MIVLLMSTTYTAASMCESKTMTLPQVLEAMDTYSPMIKSVQEETNRISLGKNIATGNLLPKLSVSEIFMRSNDPVFSFGSKLQQSKFTQADFDLGALNNPKSVNHWQTRIEFMQPIYHSGALWISRKQSRDLYRSSKSSELFFIKKLKLDVSDLYLSIMAMNNQVSAINAGIKKLQHLEKSYQLINQPNSASKSSYLIAKSIRINFESKRIYLYQEIKNRSAMLSHMIGCSPDHLFMLDDALPQITSMPIIQEKKTGQLRQDIQASADMLEYAKKQVRISKAAYGPNLDFRAAYNRYTGDFEGSHGAYEIGVSMSLPLFDGMRRPKLNQSKAMLKKIQLAHQANMLSFQMDQTNSQTTLMDSYQRYQSMSRAAILAYQAMQLANTRYEEGSLPLKDYSQAIQHWVEMASMRVQCQLDVNIAKLHYNFHHNFQTVIGKVNN